MRNIVIYNLIEQLRNNLLNDIRMEALSLFPLMQQAYRCPTNLYYRNTVILSKRGVQQGDPYSPVAFSIGLKNLSHALLSRLNAWFPDDDVDEFSVVVDESIAFL